MNDINKNEASPVTGTARSAGGDSVDRIVSFFLWMGAKIRLLFESLLSFRKKIYARRVQQGKASPTDKYSQPPYLHNLLEEYEVSERVMSSYKEPPLVADLKQDHSILSVGIAWDSYGDSRFRVLTAKLLKRGYSSANAEVSHGDRQRQPDTHSTHNQP